VLAIKWFINSLFQDGLVILFDTLFVLVTFVLYYIACYYMVYKLIVFRMDLSI